MIRSLATQLLSIKRERDGKQTGWQVIAGLDKIAEHEDDLFCDLLFIVNASLYTANIPLCARKAINDMLRQCFKEKFDGDYLT